MEKFLFGDYSIGRFNVYGIERFEELSEYIKAFKHNGADIDALLERTHNGVIIDEYWARVQDFSVGDTLTMYADERHTDKIGDFTVAGFWDCSSGTTDRAFLGVSLNNYKRLVEQIPLNVFLKTSSPDAVARDVSEKYIDTDIAAVTVPEYISVQITAIHSMIGMMLACVALGAIIVVCGIVSNLIVSFIRRKKEYAVMYSVCMSKSQLKRMILWEFLFSSASIWLVSVTAGYVLSEYFFGKLANRMGMTLDYRFNAILMLSVLGVMFAIHAMTIMFPIRRLNKLNVMEELKYE